MNADALAAVVAAARLIAARRAPEHAPAVASRWSLAGRIPAAAEPVNARILARAATRWSMRGRM